MSIKVDIMDDPVPFTISLAAVAAHSEQLVVTLQTYLVTESYTDSDIKELAGNIAICASALKELDSLVAGDDDSNNAGKIFKADGIQAIHALAAQCEVVLNAIAIILNIAMKDTPRGKRRVPEDASSLKVLKIAKMVVVELDNIWASDRLAKCNEFLAWTVTGLIFRLRIAKLAEFQIRNPGRVPGAFEEEQGLRALAERISRRHRQSTKSLAREHAKPDDDTSSVSSHIYSTTSSSASLAVAEPPPIAADIDGQKIGSDAAVIIGTDEEESERRRRTERWAEQSTISADPTEVGSNAPAKAGDKLVEEKNVDEPAIIPAPLGLAQGAQQQQASPPTSVESTALGETTNSVQEAKVNPDKILPAHLAKSIERNASTSTTPSPKSKIPFWLRRLFTWRRRASETTEPIELEAYLLEPTRLLTKLQLTQKQIQSTYQEVLARTQPARSANDAAKRKMVQPQDLSEYLSLPSWVRRELDSAMLATRLRDPRQRALMAVDARPDLQDKPWTDREIVFFMAVGEAVEPIHLTDAIGRKLIVPYEHCRTVELIRNVIDEAIANMPTIAQRIRAGQFDIFANGEVVLPRTWESTIRPGMRLEMRAWRAVPTFGGSPVGRLPNPIGGFGGFPPRTPFVSAVSGPPLQPWAGPPRPPGMMPPGLRPPGGRPPGAPRPPPAQWLDIVQVGKKRSHRKKGVGACKSKRKTGSSISSSSSTSTYWGSQHVIDSDLERAGLAIDFASELEMIKSGMGAVLAAWTNAPDTEGDTLDDDSSYVSDTSSESSVEIVV